MMLMLAFAQMRQSRHYTFMSQMYLQYQRLIFYSARHFLGGNAQLVEDVVGDSLLALLEHAEQLQCMEEEQMKRYIIATVRSKSMDVFRRKKQMEAFFTPAPVEEVERIPDHKDVEGVVMAREALRWVRRTLHTLPPKESAAFQLKVQEGWTDEAIADSLDISVASVRKYVSRVREKLRAGWNGEEAHAARSGGKRS